MIAGAIVAVLSILATPGSSVQAVDYDFVSIYSSATTLADFNVTPPAVNSAGAVAFAALIADPVANRSTYIVFRSEGGQLVALLNLTDSLGAGSPGPLVINDAGAIALHYTRGDRGHGRAHPARRRVRRAGPSRPARLDALSGDRADHLHERRGPGGGAGDELRPHVVHRADRRGRGRWRSRAAHRRSSTSARPRSTTPAWSPSRPRTRPRGQRPRLLGLGRPAGRRGRGRPVPGAEPPPGHQQRRPRAQRLRRTAAVHGPRRRGERHARGQTRIRFSAACPPATP